MHTLTLTLARSINLVFDIFYFLLIVRIILGFFPINPYTNSTLWSIVQFLHAVTEPVLAPFRRLIPPVQIGSGSYIDFSPIIALFVISLLQRFVVNLLLGIL